MKKIISVVGARPIVMKVAPIHRALQAYQDRVHILLNYEGKTIPLSR